MTGPLLDDSALEQSSVVANNAMNRERQLAGPNSYERELGFSPFDWLRARLDAGADRVSWLDLCCGSGRALAQAAERFDRAGLGGRVVIVGLDLVDYFAPASIGEPLLRLICGSVTAWTPAQEFDLVTCVHGLHYVGDKLGALTRAAGWLVPDGWFVADLDLASILVTDGSSPVRALRQAGFGYDARRRRIECSGRLDVSLPYEYLGAEDRAGPNYTHQPAVTSHYRGGS